MKGNLKKAVIMLMSLGFVLGIAIGKIQDDVKHRHSTRHHQSIIFHSPSVQVHTSGLQNEIQLRIEEKLRRVEELQQRAHEKAERAEKLKLRFKCQ